MSLAVCEQLAAQYREQGLRPIVDPLLLIVLADCHVCRAQDADPDGIHRPVRVVPRGKTVTSFCTACDYTHERRL